jgi:FkbM family methyltransferase
MVSLAGRLGARDKLLACLCRVSWRFYSNSFLVVSLDTGKTKIRVPLINGIGLRNLEFDHNPLNPTYKENWIHDVIRAIYQYRTGTFVDGGANIGKILISLFLFDRSIPYIAFEPNINCCFYVSRLIAENRLPSHFVFPVGLSDQAGVATLSFGEDFDVSATAVDDLRQASPDRRSTKIVVERGDRFLTGEKVAVVKLDIEGGELAALRGMSETIATSRPVMMIEILDFEGLLATVADVRRRNARAIGQFLAERDYALFRMTSGLTLAPMQLPKLDEALHRIENNYIAVPTGEAATLLSAYRALQSVRIQQ